MGPDVVEIFTQLVRRLSTFDRSQDVLGFLQNSFLRVSFNHHICQHQVIFTLHLVLPDNFSVQQFGSELVKVLTGHVLQDVI